jgi:hypothetical protein
LGMVPVGASGEKMAELRVSELMDTPVGSDGEVTPDVGGGLELDTLDETRSRLEALVGVLSSDTSSKHVVVDVTVSLLCFCAS